MKFIKRELKIMLKTEILMVFRVSTLVLAIPFIFSCATQKELGTNANAVKLNLVNSIPYCGGAAPSHEIEIPRLEPLKDYALILYSQNDDGSRGAELKTVKTDVSGEIAINLPTGQYQLWLPTKKLSLEEFIKVESPDKDKNFSYKDKECFQAWKERADFSFYVKTDTIIFLQYKNRCYTYAHPCLRYDGPYKP